jgi:hypothetical protein
MSEDAEWKAPDGSGIRADWQIRLAQFKASIPMIRDALELVASTYPDYAAQYKRYFDALVTGGFTPEQALEIVKAHGWMPK